MQVAATTGYEEARAGGLAAYEAAAVCEPAASLPHKILCVSERRNNFFEIPLAGFVAHISIVFP